MSQILEFKGEYAFLSNFSHSVFVFTHPFLKSSWAVPTAEHAYQASKTVLVKEIYPILTATTPGKAKRLGQKVTLIEGWDDLKVSVMRDILISKFGSSYDLCRKLIDTYPHHLEEGNCWGDRYWGTVNRHGENMLGKLLMEIRDRFRGSFS